MPLFLRYRLKYLLVLSVSSWVKSQRMVKEILQRSGSLPSLLSPLSPPAANPSGLHQLSQNGGLQLEDQPFSLLHLEGK